jgi:hypothetical protein
MDDSPEYRPFDSFFVSPSPEHPESNSFQGNNNGSSAGFWLPPATSLSWGDQRSQDSSFTQYNNSRRRSLEAQRQQLRQAYGQPSGHSNQRSGFVSTSSLLELMEQDQIRRQTHNQTAASQTETQQLPTHPQTSSPQQQLPSIRDLVPDSDDSYAFGSPPDFGGAFDFSDLFDPGDTTDDTTQNTTTNTTQYTTQATSQNTSQEQTQPQNTMPPPRLQHHESVFSDGSMVDLTSSPPLTRIAKRRRESGSNEEGSRSSKRRKSNTGQASSADTQAEVETLDLVDINDDRSYHSAKEAAAAAALAAQRADEASKPIKLSAFQCVICLDQPTDLTVTHCGHLFCSYCLHSAVTSGSKKNCPVCRQSINISPPKNGKVAQKGVYALEMKLKTRKKGKGKVEV